MMDKVDKIATENKFCSGCKKYKSIEIESKNCFDCRERGKLNREKLKAKKIECLLCTNKKTIKEEHEYKDYCGQHQRRAWAIDQTNKGKKVCANFVRGCLTIITVNTSKCEKCLAKDRIKDNANYHKKKEEAIKANEELMKNY